MRIDRVALEETANQHNFRRKQMQTGRNRLGVFAEDARAFFDDFHHAAVSGSRRFKDNRGQHRELHFIGGLNPANQFIEIIQRKDSQNFRREIHLTAT